jgi:aspartyl-tRNA synthetase
VFVDLRDRSGIVQLVFNEGYNGSSFVAASQLRPEYVIRVTGEVRRRETPNPKLKTGEIEIWIEEISVLNTSRTPPIGVVKQEEVSEELRLRYRYIDLRREEMRNNIIMRHRVVQEVSGYLNSRGFLSIETPFLTKSTPEGARDFLVPSRLNRGKFYALPQSPQIFKQLLMVAGFERYYQIVKCFRDEDLRADRQPEFTQIDIECSFIEEGDIFTIIDEMFRTILQNCYGTSLHTPIRRLTYEETMEKYGSDRPDLRVPLHLFNMRSFTDMKPRELLKEGLQKGQELYGLLFPQIEGLSRKVLDGYAEQARRTAGIELFTWLKADSGSISGPMTKLYETLPEGFLYRLMESGSDDSHALKDRPCILLALLGDKAAVRLFLGGIRAELGHQAIAGRTKGLLEFCWVTDFPLFEWSEEEKRLVSVHHPFTAPRVQDLDFLEQSPRKVRSRSYDLVLNGVELGGGSIRIHDTEMQKRVFALLGLRDEEAAVKFGFLLDALQYGAPPHGGIAFGLDRILMLLQGEDSIRDVIPVPKTTSGTSPLSGAPDAVSPQQLSELGLRLI